MADTGLITIVAPLDSSRRATAASMIESWGNRAGATPETADLARRLAETPLHFMSGHALDLGGEARLYFEISADGPDHAVLGALAAAMKSELEALFAAAVGTAPIDLVKYLMAHRVEVGAERGLAAGLAFRGVPGPTVEAIKRQDDLARTVTGVLGAQPPHRSALERLQAVRSALGEDPRFSWVAEPPPWPKPETPRHALPDILVRLAQGFSRTFLDRALILALGFALAVTAAHYLLWRPVLERIGAGRRS